MSESKPDVDAVRPPGDRKPRREPMFSRSRLFVISAVVMAASLLFFRDVVPFSQHDLQLPVVVIALTLATFIFGQFLRHRLHRSWIAWTILGVLLVSGYVTFHWQFGNSRRESGVADLIADQGGRVVYDGVRFTNESGSGYFSLPDENLWLPTWITDISGKSYFAPLETIDLRGNQLGDKIIPRLSAVRKLEHLRLAESAVTSAGVAELPVIPGLKQIDLDWRQVSPAAMQRLAQFRELELLSIAYPGQDFWPNEPQIVEAHLTDLAGLNQIKHLRINYDPAITEADATALASLSSLRALSIRPADLNTLREVQPAGALMPLGKATELEFLDLWLHSQEIFLEELEAVVRLPIVKRVYIRRWNQQPFTLRPEQVQPLMKKYSNVEIDIDPVNCGAPGDN